MRPFFATLVLLFSLTTIATFGDALPTPGSRIQSSPVIPTHNPFSSTASLPPAPTTPAHWRHVERDDHDGREKESKTTENRTKTVSKGKTVFVNVTTVVVVPDGGNKDPSKVYPNDNDHANQQDASNDDRNSSNNGAPDPNDGNNVTEQLKQDQAALKRMITILSVVGGVGAIAVVLSVLVFTRMRAKKRKRFDAEEEALRANGSSSNSNNNNDAATIDSTSTSRGGLMATATETTLPLIDTPSSAAQMNNTMPIPSAPPAPAPFLATLNQSTYERRQNVISTISQSAPAPSAPSAKELDAMIELPSRQVAGSSSSSAAAAATTTTTVVGSSRSNHDHHSPSFEQDKPCPHCDQGHHHLHPHRVSSTSSIEPPEAPPPAYTPSAPPIYALPPEPIVLFRRHSQG